MNGNSLDERAQECRRLQAARLRMHVIATLEKARADRLEKSFQILSARMAEQNQVVRPVSQKTRV